MRLMSVTFAFGYSNSSKHNIQHSVIWSYGIYFFGNVNNSSIQIFFYFEEFSTYILLREIFSEHIFNSSNKYRVYLLNLKGNVGSKIRTWLCCFWENCEKNIFLSILNIHCKYFKYFYTSIGVKKYLHSIY